jgi:hypothetical protein
MQQQDYGFRSSSSSAGAALWVRRLRGAPGVALVVLALLVVTFWVGLRLLQEQDDAGGATTLPAVLPTRYKRGGLCGDTMGVPLSEVTALLFQVNRTACFERVPALFLNTLGAGNHHLYQMMPNNNTVVDAVQCVRSGWDGRRSHWTCEGHSTAELNVIGFGPMWVICEGWDRPEDAYIRQDSCVLQYEVRLRPKQMHFNPGAHVTGYATGWVV